jgi:hypothetical protein
MKNKFKQRIKLLKFISIFFLITGLVLLIYMVVIEDEPGAVPILMISVGGLIYYFSDKKVKE